MLNSLLYRNINFSLFKSNYLDEVDNTFIQSNLSRNTSGSGVSKSTNKSIITGISEYFERERFKIKSNNSRNIIAYKLLSNEKFIINDYETKSLILNDTCGLASYTDSKHACINAIYEFVERQSLVLSYLSKTQGKLLKINYFSKIIPNIYKKFDYFDISIISSCYCILGIGEFGGHVFIGLGTSVDIKDALRKCIKELEQFRICYKVIGTYGKDKFKTSNVSFKNFDYADIYESLENHQIIDAYSYLYGESECDIYKCNYKTTRNNILEELYYKYEINPCLIFLDSRGSVHQTIVKVFDLNWFPGINPSFFKSKTYEYIENKTGKTLDRECNFIPFP